MTAPWWSGLAAAETAVECGGEAHRVAWSSGQLHTLDHADADGERALAALGGQACPCVELLDAWQRHATDLRVLSRASRGPADILSPGDEIPGGLRSRSSGRPRPVAAGWISAIPLGGPGRARGRRSASPVLARTDPDDELIQLLGLGDGLPDRLQASVIATWTRRLEAPDEECARLRPQLEAALYGRLGAALRVWLGRSELDFDLRMTPPDMRGARHDTLGAGHDTLGAGHDTLGAGHDTLGAGQPTIAVAAAPRLTRPSPDRLLAELPFAWLSDVWARGLASVMGRFCLAATTTDGGEWTLSTVGPALGRPVTMTIRLAQPHDGGR